jgi:hypothetical protein
VKCPVPWAPGISLCLITNSNYQGFGGGVSAFSLTFSVGFSVAFSAGFSLAGGASSFF